MTYESKCFPTRLRFLAAFFVTPFPFFFAAGRRVGVFLGVDVLEPDTLKWATVPLDFAIARILTRRSEMARGVGASWSFAVSDLTS